VVVVWARPMHAEVVWGRWIWVAAAATLRRALVDAPRVRLFLATGCRPAAALTVQIRPPVIAEVHAAQGIVARITRPSPNFLCSAALARACLGTWR